MIYQGPLFDGHMHAVGALSDPHTLIDAFDRGAEGRPVTRAVLMAAPMPPFGGRVLLPAAYHRSVGTWAVGKRLSWWVLACLYTDHRYFPDNSHVAQLVASAPHLLVGFAFIDPGSANPVDEARSWIEDAGMAGLKLHGWLHRIPLLSDPVQQLAEYAGQQQVPILLHPGLGPGRADDLDELIRAHPQTTFIVPHLDEDAIDVAARRANVFLDTSGLGMTSRHLKRALRRAGAGKLIFGSDAPRQAGGDLAYSLRLLEQARLPSNDMVRICWSTLTSLIARKFEPASLAATSA